MYDEYSLFWKSLKELVVDLGYPPTPQVLGVLIRTLDKKTGWLYPEIAAEILKDVYKVMPNKGSSDNQG